MKKNTQITVLYIVPILFLYGCEKFLEEKSDKNLSVPATVEDFQAMLNNSSILNGDFISSGEVSSDDYYISDADFNALYYESDKRLYTWQPDYVNRPLDALGHEWYNCYRAIFVCNSVIQGLEENNLMGSDADNVKGQALVFRAARYLDGVQIWAPAYNKQSAHTDLGMVLRLDADMNIPSVRSTVQQTYDLIIKDLSDAIILLSTSSLNSVYPAKATAYGLLSRTYLYMGEYENALEHAITSLEYTNAQLLDFNELDYGADFPIPAINSISQEMMLWTTIFYADPLAQPVAKITSDLLNLYEEEDLRKIIYFRNNEDDSYSFKGTHFGYFSLMNSLTPAEILLIIAECNARLGNLPDAADALNQLLIKRFRVNYFRPYTFTDNETALQTILTERRKELVMRGLRWPDIKRLNRDGHNITLTRIVNGEEFILPPNDLRFAIAIPEDVVEISGIEQNSR